MKITMTQKNVTVEQGFDQFLKFKKVNNLSPESLAYYKRCMKYFGEFYDMALECNTITQAVFCDYIEYLQNRQEKIKDTTINSYLRGLRAILYFYMDMGYMNKFNVKLIRADKEIKECYSDEELERLLKKPDINTCTFAEYRTYVLTAFLLGTGVRISTALDIRVSDLHLSSREFLVRKSKSRRQSILPLSATLIQILIEYVGIRNGDDDDYLFCSQNGEIWKKSSAQHAIRRYNLKRGVPKTSAHRYRHTFAKHYIMSGGDIFTLQAILGHSSLDMVRTYVNLYGQDLHNRYNQLNKLDSLCKPNKKNIKMR